MGFDELLGVLREEAANEERTLREEAARDAARVVEEARLAAGHAREQAISRERDAQAARRRSARDAAGLGRERALLAEGRRQLALLRAEALAALPGVADEEDLARLVGEVVAEAGPGIGLLVVDPGATSAARRALAAIPGAAALPIREAPAARGGVELETGPLVLDDTLPARLERAWNRAEPELAFILLGEG